MSGSYTIKVTSSVKDAILKAVESEHERAHEAASLITFKADDSFEEWTRVNEPELTRLKNATLLATEIGYNFKWKLVEEEDSAE